MKWATRRQLIYGSVVGVFLLLALGGLGFYFFDAPATCFDGSKNQDEVGIDCGGSCERLCAIQVTKPVVVFSRAFQVSPGNYSLLAYIDNPNIDAGVREAPYTFSVYDENNVLIAERKGVTFLSPRGVTPVFESGITTGASAPARTFFEFDPDLRWFKAEPKQRETLEVRQTALKNTESAPRIDAVLANTAVEEVRDVNVVAMVFNARGNVLAASQTEVESIAPASAVPLVFTWPYPFQKEIEACAVPVDVMLVLDTSGSMNDDGSSPPQPVSFAKAAARAFVNRLNEGDSAGAATFATEGALLIAPTQTLSRTAEVIGAISIDPKEEQGSTNLGEGIQKAVEALSSLASPESRRKVIIALTDGLSNAPGGVEKGEAFAAQKAEEARKATITVYTIGLGSNVNTAFLESLASQKENHFSALTGRDLDSIYRNISGALCERGPARIEIIPRSPHDIVWKAGS